MKKVTGAANDKSVDSVITPDKKLTESKKDKQPVKRKRENSSGSKKFDDVENAMEAMFAGLEGKLEKC